MHHLADQASVSDRLLAVSRDASMSEDRRVVALQAMEGHVRADQVASLLALAIDPQTCIPKLTSSTSWLRPTVIGLASFTDGTPG